MQRVPACPACQSEKTRRGGSIIWTVYITLIAMALTAVLVFHLNAAIVAAIVVAVVLLAHLLVNQRVCLDCGHQWRG